MMLKLLSSFGLCLATSTRRVLESQICTIMLPPTDRLLNLERVVEQQNYFVIHRLRWGSS